MEKLPLLLTSDGQKMGKTERGVIWLDPERTSPYEFFQYWRNVDDADVGKLLRIPPQYQLVFAIAPFALGAGYLTGRAGLFVLAGGVLAYFVLNPLAYIEEAQTEVLNPRNQANPRVSNSTDPGTESIPASDAKRPEERNRQPRRRATP